MFRRVFSTVTKQIKGFVAVSPTQYIKYKTGGFYIYHTDDMCQYVRNGHPYQIQIAYELANKYNPLNRNCRVCGKKHN